MKGKKEVKKEIKQVANLAKQVKAYEEHQHDREIDLSSYSHARVGMGHTGGHLQVQDWLEFEEGFAQAKDAVFTDFDMKLIAELCDGLAIPYLKVDSEVTDPTQFLLRPDLGRCIAKVDEEKLASLIKKHASICNQDILIVISGGLSPVAIEHQMPEFLPGFVRAIQAKKWTLAPIVINPKGRVALGDHLNDYFKAKIVVMLIGERPGLSSADSLGIYFTYGAKKGCTDEVRNCISNIHHHGLSCEEAVDKLMRLLDHSLRNKISGVNLKDDKWLIEGK